MENKFNDIAKIRRVMKDERERGKEGEGEEEERERDTEMDLDIAVERQEGRRGRWK